MINIVECNRYLRWKITYEYDQRKTTRLRQSVSIWVRLHPNSSFTHSTFPFLRYSFFFFPFPALLICSGNDWRRKRFFIRHDLLSVRTTREYGAWGGLESTLIYQSQSLLSCERERDWSRKRRGGKAPDRDKDGWLDVMSLKIAWSLACLWHARDNAQMGEFWWKLGVWCDLMRSLVG